MPVVRPFICKKIAQFMRFIVFIEIPCSSSIYSNQEMTLYPAHLFKDSFMLQPSKALLGNALK